ncbi:RluA family pseudouridine synthase [Roseospirillum parvum]|uniref:23S rRNA pseudouridine955/2504/2580 synthase n=1 Tax=Roseospirillum parvum TaxID=83401 RepID=A0A1G7ZAV1_9PROT|nr:RluA family pseudouridine synthase [Roseospirillum parvum]SDH05749.1 23S rRNA pseudouridine955/2504/2580 synthase [Roseospirillum parvum]
MAVKNVTVAAEEAEIRLDRWFRRHYPELPHGRLEKMLRKGEVRVDGGRAKAGQRLLAGQVVRVPPLPAATPAEARPAPPPRVSSADLDALEGAVLLKDRRLVALNKPAGLAVQGGTNTHRHLDGLLGPLAERLFGPGAPPLSLVHRLDRDTSGVLVLARDANSAAALARAFKSREAEKVYWALVVGRPRPAQGTIKGRLDKTPGGRGERVSVTEEGGKSALTDYTTLATTGQKLAWLALRPRTGRTHQLRAHTAQVLGTPILGDGKYGGADAHPGGIVPGKRLHLHARALRLPHPDGGTLTLTAPLPGHMAETFALLGLEAPGDDPFEPFAAADG